MKNILVFLVALFSLSASAQNPVPVGAANSWVYIQGVGDFTNVWNAKLLDTAASKMIFPLKMVNRWAQQDGVIYYNPTGTKFIPIGGMALDTSSLSSRIDQRVKYTDTAAMLISYATKAKVLADSNTLASATNQRVKYTDTAAMLVPYARTSKVSADSAVLAAAINQRVRYTDTSAMLLPYATDAQLADTGTAIRSAITAAGANAVKYTDTSAMLAPYATKLKVVADSLVLANATNARVKYTDTSTMLLPYSTKSKVLADSMVLAAATNTRVKYTDTAALLTPYARKQTLIDTAAAIQSRLNTKQNFSDTTVWDATKKNLADTSALLRSLMSGSSGWSLTGNSGTSPGTNFLGTTDMQDLVFKVNSIQAGRISQQAYGTVDFGLGNYSTNIFYTTRIGTNAGMYLSGQGNTAIGYNTLSNAGSVSQSVALGAGALSNLNSGRNVIGIGYAVNPDFIGTAFSDGGTIQQGLNWANANGVFTGTGTYTGDFAIRKAPVNGTALAIAGSVVADSFLKAGLFDYTASNASTLSLNINTEYAFYGTTAIYTLPIVSGNKGKWVRIVNIGSGTITLNSNSGGNDIFTTAAVPTTPIAAGGVVTLKCYTVGANTYWKVSE